MVLSVVTGFDVPLATFVEGLSQRAAGSREGLGGVGSRGLRVRQNEGASGSSAGLGSSDRKLSWVRFSGECPWR